MSSFFDNFLGKKVGGARVIPLGLKIVGIFTIFLLISNFASNYLNLMLNRSVLLREAKELLVRELKEVYGFADTQYEIYQFNNDLEGSLQTMEKKAGRDLKNSKAVFLGVKEDGSLAFASGKMAHPKDFPDKSTLSKLNQDRDKQIAEGFINFRFMDSDYFGVYKYNTKWNIYFLRGEEKSEFYAESRKIFIQISLLILAMTIACAFVGIYLIQDILRFLGQLTRAIMKMSESQKLEIVDLKGASNDEVTYLGMAFNALSSSVDNLLFIFQKFASKDLVTKAYEERSIKLDGKQMELAILFTDIKGFTTMTEALGTDIIKLLNIHYDKAIYHIFKNEGIIGSIIGDALLAVYGSVPKPNENKSFQAIDSAYKISDVARQVRMIMHERKEDLVRQQGALTAEQQKVYKAVLIEVGVGIDGGQVFYGNIGSPERMTNTVIGDNVNSAARLEGLTRIYKVPVICSEYIKDDIEKNVPDSKIRFIHLDRVQVKGKTVGKEIYWPILEDEIDANMTTQINDFEKALKLYFGGEWAKAYKIFAGLNLPVAQEFAERTNKTRCPKDWNGIWEMKTK
jgi:class 3 adenylate cyclase